MSDQKQSLSEIAGRPITLRFNPGTLPPVIDPQKTGMEVMIYLPHIQVFRNAWYRDGVFILRHGAEFSKDTQGLLWAPWPNAEAEGWV